MQSRCSSSENNWDSLFATIATLNRAGILYSVPKRIHMRSLLLLLIATPATAQTLPGAEFFETKIRPILATQCVGCHGAARHEGGLRLDSRALAVVGGKHGAAVNPDRPAESLLLKAIRYT